MCALVKFFTCNVGFASCLCMADVLAPNALHWIRDVCLYWYSLIQYFNIVRWRGCLEHKKVYRYWNEVSISLDTLSEDFQDILVCQAILDFTFGAIIRVNGIYYNSASAQWRMVFKVDRTRSKQCLFHKFYGLCMDQISIKRMPSYSLNVFFIGDIKLRVF
jgi:hypothetical protein